MSENFKFSVAAHGLNKYIFDHFANEFRKWIKKK